MDLNWAGLVLTAEESTEEDFDLMRVVAERHVEVFSEYMREVAWWLGRSGGDGKK